MKNYEYLITSVSFKITATPKEELRIINEEATKGWGLVSVIREKASSEYMSNTYYFKREIQ